MSETTVGTVHGSLAAIQHRLGLTASVGEPNDLHPMLDEMPTNTCTEAPAPDDNIKDISATLIRPLNKGEPAQLDGIACSSELCRQLIGHEGSINRQTEGLVINSALLMT